jgi:hypothetical protein
MRRGGTSIGTTLGRCAYQHHPICSARRVREALNDSHRPPNPRCYASEFGLSVFAVLRVQVVRFLEHDSYEAFRDQCCGH